MTSATNYLRGSAVGLFAVGLLCAGCTKNSETNQGNPQPAVTIQPAAGTTIPRADGTEELVIPPREVNK